MDGREDSLDQWNAKIGEAMQIRLHFMEGRQGWLDQWNAKIGVALQIRAALQIRIGVQKVASDIQVGCVMD